MSSSGFVKNVVKCISDAGAVVISNPHKIETVLGGEKTADIDVLVSYSGYKILKKKLLQVGFYIETKRSSLYKTLFFIFAPKNNKIIMIDVYWRFFKQIDGALYELSPSICNNTVSQANQQPDKNLTITSEYRSMFILIGILFKGNSYSDYSDELKVSSFATGALRRELKLLGCTSNQTDQVELLFKSGAMPTPECIKSLRNKMFIKKNKFIYHTRWLFRMAPMVLGRALNRPPVISIIGLDGTGKTTLTETLTSCIPIKMRVMYWGSRRMLLPTTKLHRWIERNRYKRDIRLLDNPEYKTMPNGCRSRKNASLNPKRWFSYVVLLLINANKYAEYTAKYFFLYIHSLCGAIVITDRYVYDEYLEYNNRFYEFNKFVYSNMYFKPTILVITTAPPELVHKRKSSISSRVARHHIEEYRSITKPFSRRGVECIELSSDIDVHRNTNKLLSLLFNNWGCVVKEKNGDN